MSSDPTRLVAVLADVERHVSTLGWDQPARLFALVSTSELLAAEPQLADRVPQGSEDAMTAIEQDEFTDGSDPLEHLARIMWPASVEGAAMALERTMLPTEHEGEIPDDPDAAAEFVASHPARIDVRLVVGVLREGTQHGLARLRSQESELLSSPQLAPDLGAALLRTFEEQHE